MRTVISAETPLCDITRELEAALVSMTTRPAGAQPFVILECSQTGEFVQFSGSASERLLLDIPPLGTQTPFGVGAGANHAAAAAEGVTLLGHMILDARRALAITSDAGPLTLETSWGADDALSH